MSSQIGFERFPVPMGMTGGLIRMQARQGDSIVVLLEAGARVADGLKVAGCIFEFNRSEVTVFIGGTGFQNFKDSHQVAIWKREVDMGRAWWVQTLYASIEDAIIG